MFGTLEEEQMAVSQTLVRAELPTEVKAWILIVATGGGLVLLTIITVTLTQVKAMPDFPFFVIFYAAFLNITVISWFTVRLLSAS